MSKDFDALRLYYNWAHALPEGEEKNQAVWTLLNSLLIEIAAMQRAKDEPTERL